MIDSCRIRAVSGGLVETLPAGFTYVNSAVLTPIAVMVEDQKVTFTLLERRLPSPTL